MSEKFQLSLFFSQKLSKLTDFRSFFGYFHVFRSWKTLETVLEQESFSKNSIFGRFLPIFANFMHRGRPIDVKKIADSFKKVNFCQF
jgi:hypothetical protein